MQNLYGCICIALNAYALFSAYFSRIGQFVKNRHMHVRVVFHHVSHEVAPNKATTTSYDDVLGRKSVCHAYPLSASSAIDSKYLP